MRGVDVGWRTSSWWWGTFFLVAIFVCFRMNKPVGRRRRHTLGNWAFSQESLK